MENLPLNIEQKIEKLSIVSFDDTEHLYSIIWSEDFTDIFNFYKQNYLPDLLRSKPELYQRISLYLTLTNQTEELTEKLDKTLLRRPIPTIEEYLSGRFFSYNGNATLYPYWKEQLKNIFKENSPVRKVIFGGSIGCLTGDTEIATLNGNKTIASLVNNYKDEWVLSHNVQENRWEADKIIDAFSTGIKDVYKITLDSGDIIKCTSNHKFLTRNNKWVSIDNGLKPGLSMMPYYTRLNKSGYVQVKHNDTEKWESRYVIVGKQKSLYKKGHAIHHKNYNKLDDRPINLCILPFKIHYDFHAKKGGDRWRKYNASIRGEEFKEYRKQKAIKANKTYKQRSDYIEKEKIRKRGWNKLLKDFNHQSKAGKSAWIGEKGKQHKKIAAQILIARNKTEKARQISRKMAENMRKLKRNKSSEEMQLILLKQKLGAIKRFKGEKSQEYKDILFKIHKKEPWYNPSLGAKENHKLKAKYNHKIISIEYIGKEEVFDITIEKNHNFALKAGIIAHNSGKSTIARKAFLYVLYRLFCYRNLRSVLNIDQDATIANVVVSMTLKQVYETNTIAFIKLMETMPCFQRVMSQRSFENFNLDDPRCPIPFVPERSSGNIYFPENILLTCGSNAGHFTGYNVVNSFCDEINEKGISEAISLLNTLDNRFSSRFQGSDIIFQSVVSSARTENSAMGEYIRHLPKDDPSILKLSPMLWEVKPDPNFVGDGTTFPVLVGNGSIPSKIITDPGEIEACNNNKYVIPAGCSLINVPTVYKSKFELQLDQSIQDIAGITTFDNNMVFRNTKPLEDDKLTPELYLEVNLLDNVDILELIEPYNLFEKNINGNWQFKRAPKAERFCHLDLATGGENHCDAGLCILHKENSLNEELGTVDTIFVVDLLLAINAKTKIDLTAIQKFLIDLASLKQIPIHTVTADQYQSEILLQQLTLSGLFNKVNKLSVDIKLEPYNNLAMLIEKGHVKVGKCPKLKKELEALVLENNKVTRTTELKDLADALVGAVWNAQVAYDILSKYEYYTVENTTLKNIDYNKYINPNTEYFIDL